jgi:PAS domain S-box-containing protein
MSAIRTRLDRIDHSLTRDQLTFSQTLHSAGRQAESFLLFSNVIAAVGLVLVAGVMSNRLTRRLRHSQLAMLRSETRFRTAFRCSPDAILITSLETGQIIDANESFSELIGIPREEYLGRTTLDLKLWKNEEQRNRFLQINESEAAISRVELEFVDQRGNKKTCLLSSGTSKWSRAQRVSKLVRPNEAMYP